MQTIAVEGNTRVHVQKFHPRIAVISLLKLKEYLVLVYVCSQCLIYLIYAAGSSTAEPMMSALSADENGSNTETDRMPQIVGVYSDPSVEYIVAVLSILRCGEAFLPLDPSWPEERILSIVTSSNAALIINCRPLWRLEGTGRVNAADWLVERCSCAIMQFNMKPGLGKQFDQPDLAWPCESKRQRKFCYLMYTSGSTGKPKGVCGTERGTVTISLWNK